VTVPDRKVHTKSIPQFFVAISQMVSQSGPKIAGKSYVVEFVLPI